jgi:HTH-type transcriptional regulator/antitoxin HigA
MAILNQRDYRVAKARAAHIQATSGSRSFSEAASGISSDVAEARLTALRDEHQKLSDDIAAYERLWGREVPSFEQMAAADLGHLPIVGRIAKGWSQKQLAEALGLKEQQIQRYESERYASVSLSRFDRILSLLGAKLEASFAPRNSGATTDNSEPFTTIKLQVLRDIQRRGWLPSSRDDKGPKVLEAAREYINEGLDLSKERAFHRKNIRSEAKFDKVGLLLWQSRVLKVAKAASEQIKVRFDITDMGWLKEFVRLSISPDAPKLALEYLQEKGIVVVVEQQLPQTYLDGAALLLSNGVPVIGLTLRYDRLDHFWFTLLHELGHIFLHFYRGLESGFLDNLEAIDESDYEKEADSFARSTLIIEEAWKNAPVRFSKSLDLAKSFASAQGIHVAIVAGRLRKERKDFSKLSELVGQGELRKLFF